MTARLPLLVGLKRAGAPVAFVNSIGCDIVCESEVRTMEMAVSEAAVRLGVSEPRVRQLLAAGRLAGRRLGRSWLVDDVDVARLEQQRRQPGRPLGAGRAWGLLDILGGGNAQWLSAPARSQVRASMRKYVGASADRWRAALVGRSRAVECQIHPAAVRRLLASDAVRSTGAVVASRRGFDLQVAHADVDHVYVDPDSWPELSAALAVRPRDLARPSGLANLVVLLPQVPWPFAGRAEVPDSVLAADLLDSPEPRAIRAGAARLNELLQAIQR
jgi:excisionase family DNA binding protein